jgi:hypothetical protein
VTSCPSLLLWPHSRSGRGRSDSDRPERNESTFRHGLFQDVLAIELLHAGVLGVMLGFFIAGAEFLFTGGLGDTFFVQRGIAAGMHEKPGTEKTGRFPLWV